jgi:catechol 2,3-dioxygenase-like lactoylglutathione lyase family enzyme
MNGISPIVHVALKVGDLDRSLDFYLWLRGRLQLWRHARTKTRRPDALIAAGGAVRARLPEPSRGQLPFRSSRTSPSGSASRSCCTCAFRRPCGTLGTGSTSAALS